MIAQRHRFHGRGSLKPVYERGQTSRSSSLSVRFLLNTGRQHYRVAVVVSKKVHKSAVARNRVRRRIYEILRTELTPENLAYDIVITIFSEKVAEWPPNILRTELTKLLSQAGILKKP